jgi:septal ring factor EnvC (AmiA/AmiB activator)
VLRSKPQFCSFCLYFRAQNDEMRGREVQEELNAVTEKRVLASLQSDQLALSSDDAKLVLDRITSSYTESERAQNVHRIEKEIESLKQTEQAFMEKLQMYEQSDRDWNSLLEKQETGKQELTRRKMEERDARKRLDEAIRLVSEAKAILVTTSTALRNVEQKVKRNASEMDRVTFTLSKKQEKVRHTLRKKADSVNGGIQLEYMSEDELTALRRKEMQLEGESQQLANMVARLSSRAEKLRARAEALDRFQKNEEHASNGGVVSNTSI